MGPKLAGGASILAQIMDLSIDYPQECPLLTSSLQLKELFLYYSFLCPPKPLKTRSCNSLTTKGHFAFPRRSIRVGFIFRWLASRDCFPASRRTFTATSKPATTA